MSYTPPAYNSVALDFGAAGYTPPAHNSVTLDFSALGQGGNGLAIVGAGTLTFAAAQPELVFPWVGSAMLSFAGTAALTVNIELSADGSLAFSTSADLTIGYQIQGTVTELGIPAQRTLRAYDVVTGALIVEGQSDPGTGAYLLDLFDHRGEVYVQCLGSAEYGPLVHGPVTPERL